MKIHFFVLIVVLLCVVEHGQSGVISDVYGNVKNKTVAIKDGVTGWLSYGKDWILGNSEEPVRTGDEVVVPKDGIFSSIYNSLLNRFVSARDNLYSYFASDDDKDNEITMYDKVKNRITEITNFVVGEDEVDKPTDLSEVRRALNTIINKQKQIREDEKDGAESVNGEIGDVGDKLHGVVEMKDWVEDHVSGARDTLSRGVNNAEETFSSTIDHLQQSGIEISEKEREVLNAISERLRKKITNVKDANEDPKQWH